LVFDADLGQHTRTRLPGYRPKNGREPGTPGPACRYGYRTAGDYAALRLLEQAARFRAAVWEGVAQAEREEFIEEQEMDARIERMLNS